MIRIATQAETLCVVCPCYNEEDVIERFYRRLKKALESLEDLDHRIHFIDDGSTDATLAILNALAERDERVRVFSLSRNFGHQAALTAGLETAEGDAVVMMDTDLQHPPELLPQLVARWRAGYDVVSAVRRRTEDASLVKRATARAFYALINRISGVRIVPNAADFGLLSRRACRALCAMPERHRFLRGMISWIGFPRALVEFEAPPRAGGESKYTFRKMLRLAADAAFSFSTAPIAAASRLGAVTVAAGLMYLAYILARRVLFGDLVPGWASLIGTLLILGGFQLTFTGLIGEYLARVFEETKRRPLYFFKQTPDDSPPPPRPAPKHVARLEHAEAP